MAGDTNLEGDDFCLNGMFHTCTYSFNWDKDAQRSEDDHKFTGLCSDFYKNVIKGKESTNFSKLCAVLAMYLKHIGTHKKNHEQECCKLFYYKLKKDIIIKFPSENYTDAKAYYGRMTEEFKGSSSTRISDICKAYSDNIEQGTFQVLGYLFDIYEYIALFKDMRKSDTRKMDAFQRKILSLANYPYKKKSLLKAEVDKIIDMCNGYKKSWTMNPYKHAADRITDNWIKQIISKFDEEDEKRRRIIEEQTKTLETNVLVAETLKGYGTDAVTNTGISIGTVFITFSILIIIFIFCKYTPYFSFLQTRVRKFRRRLNKNNKNNIDLMHSFDVEYKNTFKNKYKIAYN
ncbi:variable surface protein [Plasmodium gonderi]|uniref:Variable surface protein n=1 Tax=Plasmodium gonderi TaxID=77519 RepID=A0A1Y1JTZ2_PLAGO|nr:variable surface protein [Plasmodium gonderi]GAW84222.1 variable surface protein [Plasmodium gonderi]